VYLAQARYALAEQVLGEALQDERRVLGEEHPEVTRAMNNLALTLERQGKYEEAEELYRQTWELNGRILGSDHPRTQIPMNNLLRVLRVQNKTNEARPLVAASLERLRRAAESPDADALVLDAYAWELLTCEPADLRGAEAALPVAQRAVELDGGKDANILDTLALAYQMTGNLDRAIETQQRAVARARAGGPYNLAELEVRLADLLLERGDVLRAARVSWGGLAGRLRDSLASDSMVGGSMVQQAQALMEEGRFAEAEPSLRACLATRQKVLPEGHWLIADARSILGVAIAGQGKFAEAEPLLLEAYTRVKDDPQAPRDCKQQARRRIVRLYESWGKPEQAAAWREHSPTPVEQGGSDG
jgi:hypothetical protein